MPPEVNVKVDPDGVASKTRLLILSLTAKEPFIWVSELISKNCELAVTARTLELEGGSWTIEAGGGFSFWLR